jgi:hypothetical protein
MIKKIDEIRNMSDDELERYLQFLSSKKSNTCAKCYKDAKKSIYIRKEDDSLGVQTKKLCKVCDNCYNKLIEFLGVEPINWNS